MPSARARSGDLYCAYLANRLSGGTSISSSSSVCDGDGGGGSFRDGAQPPGDPPPASESDAKRSISSTTPRARRLGGGGSGDGGSWSSKAKLPRGASSDESSVSTSSAVEHSGRHERDRPGPLIGGQRTTNWSDLSSDGRSAAPEPSHCMESSSASAICSASNAVVCCPASQSGSSRASIAANRIRFGAQSLRLIVTPFARGPSSRTTTRLPRAGRVTARHPSIARGGEGDSSVCRIGIGVGCG